MHVHSEHPGVTRSRATPRRRAGLPLRGWCIMDEKVECAVCLREGAFLFEIDAAKEHLSKTLEIPHARLKKMPTRKLAALCGCCCPGGTPDERTNECVICLKAGTTRPMAPHKAGKPRGAAAIAAKPKWQHTVVDPTGGSRTMDMNQLIKEFEPLTNRVAA